VTAAYVRAEVQYEHHHVTLTLTEAPTVTVDGAQVQPVQLRLDCDTDGSHIVLIAARPDGETWAYSAEALGGWPKWVLALAEEHRPAGLATQSTGDAR
jgi:hypothetical protein